MGKATLVSLDIETGASVIAALEDGKVTPKVALWMTTPEYEDGRLVIASPALDQINPLHAYQQIAKILHGKFPYSRPDIMVMRMRDPLIRELRQLFGKTESVEGMRLGGQTIGHRYISDAYVYRIR